MSDAVIVGLIGAFASLIVGTISGMVQMKKSKLEYKQQTEETEAKYNQSMAVVEYKMDNVQKSVDELKQINVRLFSVEKDTELLGEKIKSANHRIDDLERFAEKYSERAI